MYLRVPLEMGHPDLLIFWRSTCITNAGNRRIGNLFLETLWSYWFVKFSSNHIFSDPLVLYLPITASPPLDPIRSQWNHVYLSFIILIFHSTCVTHINIRNVVIRPVVIVYPSPFHGFTISLTHYNFLPESCVWCNFSSFCFPFGQPRHACVHHFSCTERVMKPSITLFAPVVLAYLPWIVPVASVASVDTADRLSDSARWLNSRYARCLAGRGERGWGKLLHLTFPENGSDASWHKRLSSLPSFCATKHGEKDGGGFVHRHYHKHYHYR